MRTIGDTLARQYPENRLKTVTLIPLQERLTGNLQVTLWVLMSAVGVVWLIGCANIANLLLARAAGRTREIALRAALGAGRGRVVRQLLTESCVLAGVAGLAGLLLASTLVQALVALSPANLPRIDEVRMDMPVLLFALGLSLVSTVLFGLVPALHGSRLDLSGALKQGGSKATGTRASARLRSALVVAEVALSVILLVDRRTAAAIVPDAPARRSRVHEGPCAGGLHGICGQGRRHGGPPDSKPVLCRCARSSACRARGQCCVGRRLPWDGTGAQDHLATFTFKADRRDDRGSGRKPSTTRSRRTTSRRWRFRFVPGAISTGPTRRSGRGSPSSTRPWHAPPFQGSRPLDSAFGRGRIPGRPGWRLSGLLATPVGRTRVNPRRR